MNKPHVHVERIQAWSDGEILEEIYYLCAGRELYKSELVGVPANLILTFEGATGVLKSAEVIK